jgi:hypothetical protein
MVNGLRTMLAETATGTGKSRTVVALLKRLFEADWAARALFIVDRTTLAIQAEDALRGSSSALARRPHPLHRSPVSRREARHRPAIHTDRIIHGSKI